MRSSLGWTLLSRDALKRAEAQLETGQGVRDEIGFLMLHQAYSDWFFPGTSVLQTRVRYAIFVPLLYRDAAAGKGTPEGRIKVAEMTLTGRLRAAKMGDGAGIIGGKIYPRPVVQSPSMIYWNALATWGILCRGIGDSFPTRSAVNRAIARDAGGSGLNDDDETPLVERRAHFINVPEPAGWGRKAEPLNFDLSDKEKRFLLNHIGSTRRPDGQQSFLARLVEARFVPGDKMHPWSTKVMQLADKEDRLKLARSRQASAMAAVGRAVYDALVELLLDDSGKGASTCRDYLELVKVTYREKALELDVKGLRLDIPTLPDYFCDLLLATQKWLSGPGQLLTLLDHYQRAEETRKKGRARLTPTLAGRERRSEWSPPAVAVKGVVTGEPLHYRWPVVSRLLQDMRPE